jgi:hypothetical protein
VVDTFRQFQGSQDYSAVTTVTFSNFIWYGPVSSNPTNSTQVRALPNRALANVLSNPFILFTGNVERRFVVAVPFANTVTQVLDLETFSSPIPINNTPPGGLGEYVRNVFNVNDFAGNASSYKVYILENAVNYTDGGTPPGNHRHQISRT